MQVHTQTQTKSTSTTFHPVIIDILSKRGLSSLEVEEFFSWDLNKLPDLTSLLDVSKVAERILGAIDANEKIGIWGDYDVDGTTSCALFHHFFKMLNIEVELLQPSRFTEGYGVHPSSIDRAQGLGVELLLTVDCGITATEACDYAKLRGIDLIITDHHRDACEQIPDAFAIVNPNRRDEDTESEMTALAGVGVAFAVCLGVKNLLHSKERECPSIYPLLQFVAIGTICDLAKLNTMNKKFVRHGLKQIQNTEYTGIKAFFSPEERKIGFIPSEKLSFQIGPLINSKGRLDHPEKALELLISTDISNASLCFNQLEICNKERKFIQSQVYEGAREKVKKIAGPDHLISVVYDPEWHEGVIGIVASRLVENFKVPAIVFTNTEEKGIIKASARSAGDLSIFNLLNENSHLFNKFGGHKAAAGLSMPVENLDELIINLNNSLKEIPEIERTVQAYYDLEIKPEDITPKLLKQLEMLEPFGMGNAKPIFKMKGIKLDSYDLLKDIHVRWSISSLANPAVRHKGISFNYIGKWGATHPEDLFRSQSLPDNEISMYFTLGINRFNGNEYIQLMVEKVVLGDF
jgi:single-stranded-DNA-specific exonuclease